MNDYPFSLEIEVVDGIRQIHFSNGSDRFAEVVFVIDGKSAKDGSAVTSVTRGFAFHPKEQRYLTKTPSGDPLAFSHRGQVEAIVYVGQGTPTDSTIDIPPFVRRKIGSKIRIVRDAPDPVAHLQVAY